MRLDGGWGCLPVTWRPPPSDSFRNPGVTSFPHRLSLGPSIHQALALPRKKVGFPEAISLSFAIDFPVYNTAFKASTMIALWRSKPADLPQIPAWLGDNAGGITPQSDPSGQGCSVRLNSAVSGKRPDTWHCRLPGRRHSHQRPLSRSPPRRSHPSAKGDSRWFVGRHPPTVAVGESRDKSEVNPTSSGS